MKICAFDQSTHTTGYAVNLDGNIIKTGVLQSDGRLNAIDRMIQMRDLIIKQIQAENPDYISIEGVQYQNNAMVYSTLSQLQGVLFATFKDMNIKFEVVAPSVWKNYIKIKGKRRNEQKKNTILWVKETHNLSVSEDEADAVGISEYTYNLKKGK